MKKTQQKQQRKKSQPSQFRKGRERTGRAPRGTFSGSRGLALNAIQTNYVNPNKFWEIRPSSTPGGMIIRAREPLGSVNVAINTTGAFAVATINGTGSLGLIPAQFPRLSSISTAYEHYKFKSARLDFMSSQPTTATGQVIMWVDYVAIDTVATTSSEALSNITSVISNIYSTVSCTALGALSRLPKYVINTNADSNVEQTAQAIMYIGTQGFVTAAAAIVGELMVEYEVELFTPSQIVGTVLRAAKAKSEAQKRELIDQLQLKKRCCDCENCHEACNLMLNSLGVQPDPEVLCSDNKELTKREVVMNTKEVPRSYSRKSELTH
jgi:hypothetical protein